MTPAEVARLLAKAAAFDQRTVGEADVLAWHEAVADIDYGDGLAAVTAHYQGNEQRLMPVHVRRFATAAGRERHRLEREDREAREIAAEEADPTRRDRSAAVQDLIRELRDLLPDGNPDALRRPEPLAWDRAREREGRPDAGPNPHYDPTVLAATSKGADA